jgi:malonyl-CoA/methylmalonyl-CoA synthetase
MTLLVEPFRHEPWAIGVLEGPFPKPDDLAVLAYSSGTTGRSKGAMLTHGSLAANSAAVAEAWAWTASDRLLLSLPLFHIHGLGVGVHGTLLTGASLELLPRFEAAEVVQKLAQGQHTLFFGVPTMYTRLIAALHSLEQQRSEQGVRLFVSGSAPLGAQTFAEFEALVGQRILERYGMTETGMNLTNPLRGERRPGTVGMPFPGQEARVVALHTREPLPDGEIGAIEVRGPHVCAGYWRNPEATAEVFHADGWFSTGDLGWRSADGYFTLTGRAKELIISGGYNIYPRELEELLSTHPAVRECAVIGAPDPEFGEHVVAVVVPNDPELPPSADELRAFVGAQLAAYKRPRKVRYVDALPRNAMGKVEKHRLREG